MKKLKKEMMLPEEIRKEILEKYKKIAEERYEGLSEENKFWLAMSDAREEQEKIIKIMKENEKFMKKLKYKRDKRRNEEIRKFYLYEIKDNMKGSN